MACELPTVACAGSGAAEIIVADQTGVLVPPDDVETLAAALERLLMDSSLRGSMGQRARAYVREHAHTPDCIRRIESFYQNVIASTSRQAE
jgi:glycosyltransferase involved in cell wall biosynthesis